MLVRLERVQITVVMFIHVNDAGFNVYQYCNVNTRVTVNVILMND